MTSIQTKEDFDAFVKRVESEEGYRRPEAFGIGIATTDESGEQMLDTWFPVVNYKANFGTAAVLADSVSHIDLQDYTESHTLDQGQIEDILEKFLPFRGDGEKKHANIELLERMRTPPPRGRAYVVAFIDDLSASPRSLSGAYLRLHLLSHRFAKPNAISLDGIFGLLENVAWTSEGPVALGDLDSRMFKARLAGTPLVVHSVDKFPRMTDYVVPSGVRIADASRVRLGAHLAEGTTVMHEGFVNFNAGTLGKSMVEGRISQGVIVGDGSDLGGSASIMGTLSGGGKEVISIGKRCLIGANAGTGISLGDDCIIEAGCYVTAGTLILCLDEEGTPTKKALELSGANGLLFRRNSVTGAVEALRNVKAVELNSMLHA